MKLGKTAGFAEGRARRGDFSMVRRGWRDLLYLNNATAEAKASGFLYLEKAARSGTIENVGASAPAPKRENVFLESSDPRAKGQATLGASAA